MMRMRDGVVGGGGGGGMGVERDVLRLGEGKGGGGMWHGVEL